MANGLNEPVPSSDKPVQKRRINWIMIGVISLAIILVATGGYFAWAKYGNKITKTANKTTDTATNTTETTPTTTTPVATVADRTNQIVVVAPKDDGSLTYYYFDTNSKKIIEKTTENNKTGFSVGTGDATQIESVQFLPTDKSFFLATEDPKKMEPEMPYIISKIYQSPDKLVFGSDEAKGEIFEAWKINKAGTKIYALIPDKEQKNRDLYEINVSDGTKTKLVSLGEISSNSPLYLNSDETKALVGKSKVRVENNYYYHDIYSETIDLSSKKVSENLLWKDNGTTQWISSEGFSFGPKLLKAVTHFKEGDNYGLRSIDVATGVSEDIYKIKGVGQASNITWSTDGSKIAFDVSQYGDKSELPSDQGIVMYDYNSKKSTQLLTTNIIRDGAVEKNRASVISGSFNDKGLAYFVNNNMNDRDINYLDIQTLKTYQIDKTLSSVSFFSGYTF